MGFFVEKNTNKCDGEKPPPMAKHPKKSLELAVLALARIMCANIHSQNGTAILAQELLSRK